MLNMTTGENTVVYRYKNATVVVSRTIEAANEYDYEWAEREANRLDVSVDDFWPSRKAAYYQITVINTETGEVTSVTRRMLKYPDSVKSHRALVGGLTDILNKDRKALDIGAELEYIMATAAIAHVTSWESA